MTQTLDTFITNLTFVNLLILSLSCHSITRLVTKDKLFNRQRGWIFSRFPYEGYNSDIKPPRGVSRRNSANIYIVDRGTFIGELLICPWCIGFWISLGVTILFALFPSWTLLVSVPFALRSFVGGYATKVGG